MAWKFDPKLSVSIQIVQRLRLDILKGRYLPGSQFPTVRQLAQDAAVNPNTMQKALTMLEAEGLLQSKGTVGRFVTEDTTVLEQARESLRRAYFEQALAGARELGITREQFLDYLKEEEEAT